MTVISDQVWKEQMVRVVLDDHDYLWNFDDGSALLPTKEIYQDYPEGHAMAKEVVIVRCEVRRPLEIDFRGKRYVCGNVKEIRVF